jgi:hypothetical protein
MNNMNFLSTAKFKYRDYVPYGWIAIEYCDVEFFGRNADKLNKAWHDIKYEKFHKKDAEIKVLERKMREIKSANNYNEETLKSLKEEKKWWNFKTTVDEKNFLSKIEENNVLMQDIKNKIEKLEEERYYSVSELKTKAKNFLREKGFLMYDYNSNGDECIDHTEMWGCY